MSDEWTRKQGKDKWDKKGHGKKPKFDDGSSQNSKADRARPRKKKWSLENFYNDENDTDYDNS
jgi:hypothetical protein